MYELPTGTPSITRFVVYFGYWYGYGYTGHYLEWYTVQRERAWSDGIWVKVCLGAFLGSLLIDLHVLFADMGTKNMFFFFFIMASVFFFFEIKL